MQTRTRAGSSSASRRSGGDLAVSEQECRDVIWALTDGTLWHQLVVERGWTDEQYSD
jgi:hypothetical protein